MCTFTCILSNAKDRKELKIYVSQRIKGKIAVKFIQNQILVKSSKLNISDLEKETKKTILTSINKITFFLRLIDAVFFHLNE